VYFIAYEDLVVYYGVIIIHKVIEIDDVSKTMQGIDDAPIQP